MLLYLSISRWSSNLGPGLPLKSRICRHIVGNRPSFKNKLAITITGSFPEFKNIFCNWKQKLRAQNLGYKFVFLFLFWCWLSNKRATMLLPRRKKWVFDNETICSASQPFYRMNCSRMTCWTNKSKSMNLDQVFPASGWAHADTDSHIAAE